MAGRVAQAGVFGERPCWLEVGRVGYGGFRERYVEVPRVNEVVAERGESTFYVLPFTLLSRSGTFPCII